jgi:hypothetical protein
MGNTTPHTFFLGSPALLPEPGSGGLEIDLTVLRPPPKWASLLGGLSLFFSGVLGSRSLVESTGWAALLSPPGR